MKRTLLIVLSLLLPVGCALIKPAQRVEENPNALKLTFNKTGDPFGGTVASLTMPGMPPPLPGVAQSGADGAPVNPLLDFTSAFTGGPARSRTLEWRRSASEAASESRNTGRPLLIFLTDVRIPAASSLQSMLATKPETGTLIESLFVPLLVDYGDKDTRDSPYYRSVRDRYKPHGFPVLIAALPDGTEFSRQTGYSVETANTPEWDRRSLQWIKTAATQGAKALAARRKRLEPAGYREWKSKSGEPVFAKLVRVDANQAIFTGEWGGTFRTFVSRLGEAEQERLAQMQSAAHQEKPAL